MRYVSTRGQAPELGFADVLVAGLANDGGLYMPQNVPSLPLLTAGASYASAAVDVMVPFVGSDIPPDVLRTMCEESYATFRHPAVCPIMQTGATQTIGVSPAPAEGRSLRSSSTTSRGGTSLKRGTR